MQRLLLSLLTCVLLLTACGQAQPTAIPTAGVPTEVPTPVPGTLYVDPENFLGPISPLVYGTNYGPWNAVQFEQIPDVQALELAVIRWPGGEWGDTNNVTKLQIDQYAAFLELVGAEGSIHVRLRDGTPEQAAELVRYANVEKEYNIRFWAIGNEPTLYSGRIGRNYDTPEFNQQWRAYAEAMKAVDPTIQLVGPEIHQFTADPSYNPKDSEGRDWMIEFLEANGDMVDIVSFHRYPFPVGGGDNNATIETLRENAYEWDGTIAYLRSLIHDITGLDKPVAVTETSSHYTRALGGEATPDSHFHAIWWGDVLGRMIRNRVTMVNHWMLTSGGGQGVWGLVGRGEIRPTYYTYAMYKQFGEEQLYSSSDDPLVSIYAAQRDDGAITIMLINLGDDEAIKPLLIGDQTPFEAQVWLLDTSHNAEDLGLQALSAGGVVLPPQSMTLLVFEP
jgi:hypothetical protein